MTFMFRKAAHTAADRKRSGGWYADPYGSAARRWYDSVDGWTDRVDGAGLDPDKTGVARVDGASGSFNARTKHSNIDGAPTSTRAGAPENPPRAGV